MDTGTSERKSVLGITVEYVFSSLLQKIKSQYMCLSKVIVPTQVYLVFVQHMTACNLGIYPVVSVFGLILGLGDRHQPASMPSSLRRGRSS